MSDPSETLDGAVLLRISQAVERFEDAWVRGEPMTLEDLLHGEGSSAPRAELLRYALAVELKHRRDRGESPTVAEYTRRFAEPPEVVRRAFTEPTTLMRCSGTKTDSSSSGFDWRFAPAARPELEKIGKFLVVQRLGEGGQGSTYLARDPDLGHLVVLKRFHASARRVDLGVATKEGRALLKVRSPLTAKCLGLERDGDEVYLVMEYIAGRNLTAAVQQGALAPRVAARLVEQVAEALEAVHACGLVHRDIKPANIVAGEDGVPRLVDFGLAAPLGSPALQNLSGTPPYMAPEVARDQWDRIDFRTDVYGLGATLYTVLTGQSPHPGRTPHESLLHAREGTVTPPRGLEPKRSIPRPLERIVMRALASDPAQRVSVHQAVLS